MTAYDGVEWDLLSVMSKFKLLVIISWQSGHSSYILKLVVIVICACRLCPRQVKCGSLTQPTKLLKPFKTSAMRICL